LIYAFIPDIPENFLLKLKTSLNSQKRKDFVKLHTDDDSFKGDFEHFEL
jgi:hypothetical protein